MQHCNKEIKSYKFLQTLEKGCVKRIGMEVEMKFNGRVPLNHIFSQHYILDTQTIILVSFLKYLIFILNINYYSNAFGLLKHFEVSNFNLFYSRFSQPIQYFFQLYCHIFQQ
jgi:hypothetical protein